MFMVISNKQGFDSFQISLIINCPSSWLEIFFVWSKVDLESEYLLNWYIPYFQNSIITNLLIDGRPKLCAFCLLAGNGSLRSEKISHNLIIG